MENTDHCCAKKIPWYKNKLTISSIFGVAGIPLLSVYTQDYGLMLYGFSFVKDTWFAIALGLLIGGMIDYYVPRSYIEKVLAQPKKEHYCLPHL